MSDEQKSHIYYGAIDANSLPTQQTPAVSDTDIQKSTKPADQNATTLIAKHQRLLEAYQLQQKAKNVLAPTLDEDVKNKLRELNQPICLFGEGPYERRERLRVFLAKSGSKHQTIPSIAHTETVPSQEQLFFSKGGLELFNARIDIAKFSLPRAIKRLREDRTVAGREDPVEVERKVALHNDSVGRKLEVYVSQIGSERPLASGKFSPDSKLFATSSWAPTVRVWHVPSCHEYNNGLHGHKERVSSVMWNPNFMSNSVSDNMVDDETTQNNSILNDTTVVTEGWNLASCSFDGTINFWSLNNPNPIASFIGHEERVNRIECHPSGRFLASTSHDETWRLWDIETGKELLGHVKQVLGISVNPWRVNQVATCSDDNTVRVWDIRKQTCIDMILAHNKLISDVVYEPNEGRYLMTISYDKTLKLWSSTEFTCTRQLVAHEARVMGGDISHGMLWKTKTFLDGKYIASVSFDRTFKLWTGSAKE